MNYRSLGKSGLKIAPLIVGTDNFANPTAEAECFAILDAALEAGLNLIDTSNSYAKGEAECIIGRWLKARGNRDGILIATKVFYPTGDGPNDHGLSRAHILRACEQSLKRLQIDYIDLYQMHRPDMSVRLEETLRAMDDLVSQGKARYMGSSTAPAWHVVESTLTSRRHNLIPIISEQSPYNLLDRRIENELIPACEHHGIGVITWSPLAMGMLAGRYSSATTPQADSRMAMRGGIYAERVTQRGVEVGNKFAALARIHGHDPAQAGLAWVLHQPGVVAPISGPRTEQQLVSALPALDLKLSAEFLSACNTLCAPGSATVNFFNSAAWMKWKIV